VNIPQQLIRVVRVRAGIGTSLLCASALLLALVTPAGAAGPTKRQQAKAAVEKGERDYKLGRFEEALEEYSHAYELFPAPALLFNLGQCHKQLKNYERAIFFFEGYLRDEQRPTNRRLAEDLVAEARAELAKQEAASTSAPTPPGASSTAAREASAEDRTAVASAPPALQAPAAAKTEPVLISAPPPARQPDTSPTSVRPTRWWLWAAIAAGVLAAGAVAYYETGAPRTVVPEGTLGTIDRR
jgi:tetratricopeptide (TPR) repeat protein